MKVVVVICCLIAACAGSTLSAGVAWPGAVALSAPLIKTFYPGETKTTAYSTTQYINSLPASYTLGAPTYHVPQLSSFAALQPHYYQVAASPFVSATNIFYRPPSFAPALVPGLLPSPIVPAPTPITPGAPSYPSGQDNQQGGDEDSAVIDSAYSSEQGTQQPAAPIPEESQPPVSGSQPAKPEQPAQSGAPQFPPLNNFPQIPQGVGLPSFPQFPQIPQLPQAPQFPQFPPNQADSGSPVPPTSFPGASNDDRGINDEDTVSVESA